MPERVLKERGGFGRSGLIISGDSPLAIYRPRLFEGWWLLDYFLTVLVIAWLADCQRGALCYLMEKAGKWRNTEDGA